MGTIVSLVDVRNARLKDSLLAYAAKGEGVVIETRTGLVRAEKLLCRASFVEVLNSFGDYSIVNYADVRSIMPVATVQASVVNASGDWAAPEAFTRRTPAAVVAFPQRRS